MDNIEILALLQERDEQYERQTDRLFDLIPHVTQHIANHINVPITSISWKDIQVEEEVMVSIYAVVTYHSDDFHKYPELRDAVEDLDECDSVDKTICIRVPVDMLVSSENAVKQFFVKNSPGGTVAPVEPPADPLFELTDQQKAALILSGLYDKKVLH